MLVKLLVGTGGALAAGTLSLGVVAAPAASDAGPSCVLSPGGDRSAAGPTPGAEPLSAEQVSNAQRIVAVGRALGMPTRAYVIALATAMQESRLRNLDYGDRDSLGLFQQRPSQGWGTPAQVSNPEYAAARFYQALDRVDGWPSMPLTVAAQAVQRSAFPDAYARWESLAASLVASSLGSTSAVCTGFDGEGIPRAPAGPDGAGPPPSYAIPRDVDVRVQATLSFALAQVGKPYRLGADGPDAYDCSSLLQAAYTYAGVRIGPTTLQQVNDGVAVWPVNAVRPGDLVFIPGSLGTRSVPRHVGMYVGSGLVVHAPRTGDVVRVTELADWDGEVVAIRRVIP